MRWVLLTYYGLFLNYNIRTCSIKKDSKIVHIKQIQITSKHESWGCHFWICGESLLNSWIGSYRRSMLDLLLAFGVKKEWSFENLPHCNLIYFLRPTKTWYYSTHVEHFKLSIMLGFSCIRVLYSNGPLNKQKVLSNVMSLLSKSWYAIQILK